MTISEPQRSSEPFDSTLATQIAERISAVEENIAAAAERSGRQPSDVRLLPVTKFVEEEKLRIVAELGYRDLGESRVQELRTKSANLAGLGINWVLIGHLQTNKAAQAARIVSEVQSVDSLKVAHALNNAVKRLASEAGVAFPSLSPQTAESGSAHRNSRGLATPLKVLLQVNTSGEDAKYGLAPDEVDAALEEILTFPALRVAGFMTMAPFTADTSVVRRTFADLRELRDRMAERYTGTLDLSELSMGMSGDYEIAVEEGATTVRIGTTIFGKRN